MPFKDELICDDCDTEFTVVTYDADAEVKVCPFCGSKLFNDEVDTTDWDEDLDEDLDDE